MKKLGSIPLQKCTVMRKRVNHLKSQRSTPVSCWALRASCPHRAVRKRWRWRWAEEDGLERRRGKARQGEFGRKKSHCSAACLKFWSDMGKGSPADASVHKIQWREEEEEEDDRERNIPPPRPPTTTHSNNCNTKTRLAYWTTHQLLFTALPPPTMSEDACYKASLDLDGIWELCSDSSWRLVSIDAGCFLVDFWNIPIHQRGIHSSSPIEDLHNALDIA